MRKTIDRLTKSGAGCGLRKGSFFAAGLAVLLIVFLLCSGCGRKAAGGLEALTAFDPKKVEFVTYSRLAGFVPGESFTLSRADYPEEVETLTGIFSGDRKDYTLRDGTFEDYSAKFFLAYLDKDGKELLKVYEHDPQTISLGAELYRCSYTIDTYSVSVIRFRAYREGLCVWTQPPEFADYPSANDLDELLEYLRELEDRDLYLDD